MRIDSTREKYAEENCGIGPECTDTLNDERATLPTKFFPALVTVFWLRFLVRGLRLPSRDDRGSRVRKQCGGLDRHSMAKYQPQPGSRSVRESTTLSKLLRVFWALGS